MLLLQVGNQAREKEVEKERREEMEEKAAKVARKGKLQLKNEISNDFNLNTQKQDKESILYKQY
jgi:hypothetical protein